MSMTEREYELEDIKSLMSTESGRRFVARLMDIAGIHRCSFTGNSTTFFNEGRREVGIRVYAEIQIACPELYTKMLDEFRTYKQQFKETDNG